MDVFITNKTALDFWRLQRRSGESHTYNPCQRKPPCQSPDSYVLRHGEAWGLSLPLDIMVSALSARRPSKAVRPHVCSKSLPGGAFVNAGNDLYVSSPEFCFFQMAGEYPLAKLIALGIELCGTYSQPDKASACERQEERQDEGQVDFDQLLYNLPHLTSKKKLQAFTDRMGGWIGQPQASKALRYISDGSGSPMETILFILLTLPYRYGGYALPMLELNGCVYPRKGGSPFAGRSFYRGVLLWREAGVVVEYNSDMIHANTDNMAMDAIHRGDLALCGISEISVTKRQLYSIELFDKVARQIASRIGKRLRYKDPGFLKVRQELRSVLF